jgi:hypothetical protein
MFWLTPPREMPPKHRQPNAPCPKLAGNAYKALVDLPHDGSDPITNGRDGNVDGTDERSAANTPQHASAVGTTAAPSPQQTPNGDHPLCIWCHELIAAAVDTIVHAAPLDCSPEVIYHYSAVSLCAIEQAHIETQLCLAKIEDNVNNNFDKLLQKIDAAWTENMALRKAYHASREETAALKAAVDALTKRINKTITMTAPPSLATMSSPTTMEEMTMQLSVIQHDIQDVLEGVCNPPGKRKRRTSNQETEPTMLTN